MRQRINIREHFWRGNAPLIQIAALQRAPEAHAPRPGGNPPGACSLVDEGPLELRHAGEDRQHHLAGR